jgi:hypothetical protein
VGTGVGTGVVAGGTGVVVGNAVAVGTCVAVGGMGVAVGGTGVGVGVGVGAQPTRASRITTTLIRILILNNTILLLENKIDLSNQPIFRLNEYDHLWAAATETNCCDRAIATRLHEGAVLAI